MGSNCHKITLRKYLNGESLFTAINSVQPFPFLDTAEKIATADANLIIYNGDKILFNGYELIPLNTAAAVIVSNCQAKWEALIKAAAELDNLAYDYVKTRVVDETQDRNKTGEGVSKVSAYNSDELLPDTGGESTEDEKSNRDLTEKETYLSFKSMFENLPLVEQSNIITTVVSDVSKQLTLSIY